MKQGKTLGILDRDERKKSQGYVDLNKLNESQLNELLQRQEKLISNKSFIARLPDKGTKILSFKVEIENALKHRRQEMDVTCELLAKLNINNAIPEDFEWKNGKNEKEGSDLDSDDDSDDNVDPLRLIATHSGTIHSARKKSLPPEPTLITDNDLKEIKEMSYEVQLCEKYGKVKPIKERFKPNQLKDNDKSKFVISAENVKKRLGKKWEITEATPPVPVFKDAKMISLSESLKLQKEQAEKLKIIERDHAIERLLKHSTIKMGDSLPTKNIMEYRSVKDVFEETGHETDNNSEDEEKGGVTFYNLIDNVPESS